MTVAESREAFEGLVRERDMGITGGDALGTKVPRAEAGPRLRLRPDHSGPAPLDGAWWPRSAAPAAELPGLILALDEWRGRVTRVMLGDAGWDASRPRHVKVVGQAGSRVVRLGWFATMPAGLLTALSAGGQRTDLVTLPPHTGERDAAAAMEQAARAGNRDHAPAILAAIPAAPGGTQRGSTDVIYPEPEHLNNHHRNTLRQLFQHPVSHNIEWTAVVSLLEAVGSVAEQPHGKFAVTVGSQTEYFDPPARKDVDVQAVVDLRRMLSAVGYGLGAGQDGRTGL